MSRLWAECRLALAFLTRLPVGPKREVPAALLGRSMAWFPLVGLLLGLGLALTDLLLPAALVSPLRDGLLVALLALSTGALHLDGVADLGDGLGAGPDRERALRIMKDSRLGTFGAVSLVLVLLLKVLALAALPPAARVGALLLTPAAGRWLAVLLAATCPYARPGGGTGQAFTDSVGHRELVLATALTVLTAAGLFGAAGLAVALLLAGAAWGAGRFFIRRLGGVTGDVLGAVIEGGEVLCLIALVAAV